MSFECVQIGDCTLYRGDCMEILPTLAPGSVDAVVTDPPYSSGGMFRGDRAARTTREKYQSTGVHTEFACFSGDNRDQRSWYLWCGVWLGECLRASKPGALLLAFSDWRQLPSLTDAVQVGGWVWRGIVPWDKVVARPMCNSFRSQAEFIVHATNGGRDITPIAGGVYMDGWFRVPTVPSNDREHSTQKPVELIEKLLPVCGHVVLDPFMGSGTTGVACARAGNAFIGCEMERRYFDIACERIEAAYAARSAPLFGDHAPKPKQLTMDGAA